MGIFATLKQTKDPVVLKALNGYLRFSTKLVEAKVRARFIKECLEGNEYPNSYWRAMRRSRMVITCDTLRRYAENELESTLVKMEELGRHVCQRAAILDQLGEDERQEFENYVQSISDKRGEIKRASLLRSIHESKPQSKIPEDPSRQSAEQQAQVARESACYKVDIAVFSETRLSKQGQQKEVGAGHISFWSGHPKAERPDAAFTLVVRNDIVG
ncbi:hypothetical protein SprV_0501877400 [Sparganum proliferum]